MAHYMITQDTGNGMSNLHYPNKGQSVSFWTGNPPVLKTGIFKGINPYSGKCIIIMPDGFRASLEIRRLIFNPELELTNE